MIQLLTKLPSALSPSPLNHSISKRRLISNSRFVLLLAGLALILNSCQKDNHKKTVPFKGQFTASSTKDGTAGTGEGTPIGKFTYSSQDNLEKFPYITCTTIIKAANGDQIFGTQTGLAQVSNDLAIVDFDNTITGGTGTFAKATGKLKIHTSVNTANGTSSATIEGTISY